MRSDLPVGEGCTPAVSSQPRTARSLVMNTYVVTVERYVRETSKFQVHADSDEEAQRRALIHAGGAGRQAMWSLSHPLQAKDDAVVLLKRLDDEKR